MIVCTSASVRLWAEAETPRILIHAKNPKAFSTLVLIMMLKNITQTRCEVKE
jgi:hypothetical protein